MSAIASGITHHDDLVVKVKPEVKSRAWIDADAYKKMYSESIENPDKFWAEQARNIDWIKPFTKVKNTSFDGEPSIKWFEDGQLNVAANCIDRHLAKRGDQIAIIWEGDEPSQSKNITYKQLHSEVCRFANVLKAQGVGKGDRVIIYMPMIVEAAYAMLACARIGAVHSVVFGGFSPSSLRGRIEDCKSKLVITAVEGLRGGKKIPLLKNVEEALDGCAIEQKVLVVGDEVSTEGSLPLEGGGLGRGCLSSDIIQAKNYGSREKKLTSLARDLRSNPAPAEDKFWQILRRKQIAKHKFRRQHEMGNSYIADFICLKQKLIVELDGSQHTEQVAYDNKRTKFLEKEGYRVLRVWNNDVFDNADGVAEAVLYLLENPQAKPGMFNPLKNTPSLTLPPQGGGNGSNAVRGIIYYHTAVASVSAECLPEVMNAEDPLFILYTSGSTGKPKGVLHTTGGYILYAMLTHKYIFDYHDGDVYWCTADVGWVTGHSYIIYGPLANGATTLMFEGVPNYPDWSRCWNIIDKHKVNIFYTAPTAIRAIMREGDDYVKKTSRKSLRVLGSVGEPINPEAWNWYYKIVGEERCPVVDTWWQTETGGVLITPLPGAIDLKPGSATLPFFGVQPAIVDNDGKILEGEAEGNLCILDSWPGQMRSVYGDHDRFAKTYFSQFKGKYFSGDGARRDKDGYYWITGRVDDVLNVSGHRIGTAEVESALVANHNVAEAAVVGYPHDIKGQGIYAFVILKAGVNASDEIKKELVQWVRKDIGPIASPDLLQFVPGLPKTRSGKIMRRILRKIAENDFSNLGDTNTLLNPEVVEQLVQDRLNK